MNRFNKITSKPNKKILVISGGGARGIYALGILKGLEELHIDKQIDTIYGVSIGALIGAFRAAGYKAEEIYAKFMEYDFFSLSFANLNLLSKKSLLKNSPIHSILNRDLPSKFETLKKKLYVGAVDANTAEYQLFSSGPLHEPLLGSMAIPGIFPAVPFKKQTLIDGGAINNFPANIARKKYPHAEIIGIALNKFKEHQPIKNIFDNLSIGFEIMLRHGSMENLALVDHAFYKVLPVGVLDSNKAKMKKAYAMGYANCLEKFKKS